VTDATEPIDYSMVGTVPKAGDLEIAVRTARVDDIHVVDIRDYVPSSNFFGRGITIPVDAAFDLAQLIASARTG
jgi:hypothetical protein